MTTHDPKNHDFCNRDYYNRDYYEHDNTLCCDSRYSRRTEVINES